MMAKIVIVLNASWNVWNFRLPLLKRLKGLGHEVIVVAPEDEYTARIPFEFCHIPIKSRSVNPVTDCLVFLKFVRIFKRVQPDILLLYTIKPNLYGNFAAWILGIKTISNIAGLGALFIQENIITSLAKSLYRIALKVPGKVFFQNLDDMALFMKIGLVSPHVAERIPGSGVDLARFSSAFVRGDEQGDSFVFLLFSRMLWDKGVQEFVDAARLLLQERKGIEFKLLGFLDTDNPKAISQEDMTELTAVNGIKYIGISDDVEGVIQQTDCVVLPSYREGVPRTLLEAAAMAKPIITTNVPGCRDVVEDGFNGFLCKPKNAEDLYLKMKAMVDLDLSVREEMGQNGRKKVEQEFDQEIVIERYVSAVNELIGS